MSESGGTSPRWLVLAALALSLALHTSLLYLRKPDVFKPPAPLEIEFAPNLPPTLPAPASPRPKAQTPAAAILRREAPAKSLDLSPHFHPRGVPLPEADAATPVDHAAVAPNDFSKHVAQLPSLSALFDRIDAHLDASWQATQIDEDAMVSLLISFHPDGSFARLESVHGAHPSLNGWVQQKVIEALAKPLANVSPSLRLIFRFGQATSEAKIPPLLAPIAGTDLTFQRYQVKAPLIQMQNGLSERSQVVSVNLGALFEKLFSKKVTDPRRAEWDLNRKLETASSACFTGAEGACVIAGQILEAFGRVVEARSMFAQGCSWKYETACREQARLSR